MFVEGLCQRDVHFHKFVPRYCHKERAIQHHPRLWDQLSCLCCVCLVPQPCLTLCDPMDCSPPGSSVNGILQARILESVAMPSSRGSSQPRDQTRVSHIAGGSPTLQADLPHCRRISHIALGSPTLQVDPLPSEPPGNLLLRLTHSKPFLWPVKYETWLIQRKPALAPLFYIYHLDCLNIAIFSTSFPNDHDLVFLDIISRNVCFMI